MRALVDTSAVYALLDAEDGNHPAARDAFVGLRRHGDLVMHNYAVAESLALVQARLGMAAVRALAGDLLPLFDVVWVEPDVHRLALAALVAAENRRVSFVDRVSFALMREAGIRRAFAFDADFAREGFELLPAAR